MNALSPKLLTLSAAILLGLGSSQALVISGSDLLGEGIRTALKAELAKSGLEAELALEGSLTGLKAFEEGTAVATILAIPEGEEFTSSGNNYPFAFQVVAFAVHSSNPLVEVTYDQLRGVYSQGGPINDWSDLTDNSNWQDRNIASWVTRSTNLISLEIFSASVLKGSLLKESVRMAEPETENLYSIVEEEPSSLILVPYIPDTADVRFLAVKEVESGQAYTPSMDNVFFGDYPLRMPLELFVSDSLGEQESEQLLKAIYSDAVADALEAANFMPVSREERQATLSQFD
jgi:hypothetical protein